MAPHAARSRAHTSRPLPSPSQASRHLRPCTNHARGGAARAEGDGYKRAPFLEPFVATVATAVLVMAFASPNMLQLFQQQAQAKSPTADGSPFADAKTMSFGVLNGCVASLQHVCGDPAAIAAGGPSHTISAAPSRLQAARYLRVPPHSRRQSTQQRHTIAA